jgi:hypothetical protein
MLDKLIYKEIPKPRKNFYASDFDKSNLDLYFSWTDEPKTNPPKWYDTLKWGAGNGVEDAMLKVLKMNGIVDEEYDQKLHGGFKIEREGITVSGYTDARNLKGEPIEIKSINNANVMGIREYENGYPRRNYVGQLSIYLDALGKDRGYLFASSIDGLHRFWFECKKVGDGIYKCGNVTVNVYDEYRRWAKLYTDHIEPRELPDLFQYTYKYPVDKIDWTKVSAGKISSARTGKSVIGDWELGWSDWKNRIVELQGTTLGYTNAELKLILEKTQGYTTWKKTRTKK